MASRLVCMLTRIHLLQRCRPHQNKRHISMSCMNCAFLDARDKNKEEENKRLVLSQGSIFEDAAKKAKRDKKTFHEAIYKYIIKHEKYRRGSVEFIYAAMNYMHQFNVNKDLETYKKLLNILPKHVMVSKTVWQAEFQHYPKQQQCIIDLMDQMEDNGVIPDDNFGDMLVDIFGTKPHVFRKYQKMMYWLPKFRNANPYPVPYDLTDDPVELAKLALKRMAVDLQNTITVFSTGQLETSTEDTFIASSNSPTQRELIANLPRDEPVFVEGGYTVWLRGKSLQYFILRANPTEAQKTSHKLKEENVEEDVDGIFAWKIVGTDYDETSIVPKASVHEQEDGTILGMCITGTGTLESLRSWISLLQQQNPILSQTPVVFSVITPEAGLQQYQDKQQKYYDKQAS